MLFFFFGGNVKVLMSAQTNSSARVLACKWLHHGDVFSSQAVFSNIQEVDAE